MPIDNPLYGQEAQGPFELFDCGDFVLEDGDCLHGLQLAYATYGKLDANRSNAILVPTWYSGTSKVMADLWVGENRALDPGKYFIIIVNQIGNGVSSSPHNTDGPFAMARFPKVRIGDDVRAQHKLITEHFGLDKLALVVGGSMGAQQTYEWAVRYPEMVERAAPVAGFAKNTDHDFLYAQTLIDSITSDPGYQNGWYGSNTEVREGLSRHAMLWSVMGWCTEFFIQEKWRELGFSSANDFQVGFMEAYFCAMDPNALLWMAWKWQRGDVSRMTNGDLSVALGKITAKTFVMPIETDMFFPPQDCEREQKLVPNSEFRVLPSICGHLGLFGIEPEYIETLDNHLKELLAS
ncbi:MAG: alpha/beta fold hydrolase [Pseudomonadota bacterium]